MIRFYHAPHSRSSSILWLLEELGEPYEMQIVNIRAEGGVPESYRAIQPNKKVPAVVHDGVTVTERAAICIHLADAFPQAGLAPPIGDRNRGAYLTWLVYHDSVFDPCITAKAQGWSYNPFQVSFGGFDDMIRNVEKTLSEQPFVAGDRFTAADVMLGGGLLYTIDFINVVPDRPAFRNYIDRLQTRPAYLRFTQKDAEAGGN